MTRRITQSSLVLAAVLLVTSGAVTTAGAVEPNTACKAEFDAMTSATRAAEFTSKRALQDEEGLLAKVGEAEAKFRMNKVADSLQKLTDYATKVSSLTAQGKVNDATGMVSAHAAAVACVTV